LVAPQQSYCGFGYVQMLYKSGPNIGTMGSNWLQEAQALAAAALNCAQNGCPLPVGVNANNATAFIQNIYAYLSDPLNCASNVRHPQWLSALQLWNAQSSSCIVDQSARVRAKSVVSDQRDTYLGVMIVFILLFTGLLCCCAVCLGYLVWTGQIDGIASTICCGDSRATINRQIGANVRREGPTLVVSPPRYAMATQEPSAEYLSSTVRYPAGYLGDE
jgi:hypothetical protein